MEGAGRGKFTQTVTNHVLADKDFFEDLAVMDQKGIANKFGGIWLALAQVLMGSFWQRLFVFSTFLRQLFVDVGSFLLLLDIV